MSHSSVPLKIKEKVQVWIYIENLNTKSLYFLILLTRPERGSFWQPVTGSVEIGESWLQAAAREAYEETGLAFVGAPQSLNSHFEYESRQQRNIEHGFIIQGVWEDSSFPVVQLDSKEHVDYRWVSAKEALESIRFSSNQKVLRVALSHVFLNRTLTES